MNDPIDEHAKKAGCYRQSLYDNGEGGWIIHDTVLREFSHRIVRDCLAQIDQAVPDGLSSATLAYKTARLAAQARIKSHFGIGD